MIEVDIQARLGGFALDARFSCPASGVIALFGRSGTGKTSIVNAGAGLLRPERGRIVVAGTTLFDAGCGIDVPVHRRRLGYVFQDGRLFPHMTVRANLLYGRRAEGRPSLEEAAALLDIAPLLDRRPHHLSGGERQRVAIGRALLANPRILLMDEPLASLDGARRSQILPYLARLRDALDIPVLYVSHQMDEILRLADTLVLLEAGRVLANGPLARLEADPALPLLRAPEAAVTLDATVAAVDEAYALSTLTVAGGGLIVPGRHGPPGSRRRLRISASDVSFTQAPPTGTTILNCLPARIVAISPHDGGDAQVNVAVELGAAEGGARIVARITRKSLDTLGLAPGIIVHAQIKSVALLASGRGSGSA